MKSDSELMNELAHKTNYLHEMTSSESSAMKRALLDIYRDVAKLCEKEGLTLMLSGGSCLGAIRHKGFIPWDDDLDVMMRRDDYEKLIRLCKEGRLGNKYEFDYPNRDTDAKTVFLKIYRKNSFNIELFNENSPFPKGLYIDVFALDSVPKYKIAQAIKGFIANVIQFVSIMVLYAQYPSEYLSEFVSLDSSLKRRFQIKKMLGSIFGIIPHAKWVYWFDRFVASSKRGNPLGIPTGRKYYNGEIFDASVYFPPKEALFEGEIVYIPADYDRYLTNLYHDYMQLPPVEKRERHFIVKFQLPND